MTRALKILRVVVLLGFIAGGNLWALEAGSVFQSAGAEQDEQQGEHKAHRIVIRNGLGMGGAFMGVQVLPLTPELRRHFGVSEDRGVMVAKVEEDSPAERAGILVGDVIIAADGEDIRTTAALSRAVRAKKEGETVDVEVIRDGVPDRLSVVVDERERSYMHMAPGSFGFAGPVGEAFEAPDVDFTFEWNEDSRDAFEGAMNELQEQMASGEWRKKLRTIESIDLGSIQERMRELEQRLHELEGELASAEKDKR